MALTLFSIQNARPREKPYKLTDGSGLHLLITTSGSKLWRYRFGGRQNMLGLGSFAEVSLAIARERRDNAGRIWRSRSQIVSVPPGRRHGFEWARGDDAPGLTASQGGNIWFSDRTRALIARDKQRWLKSVQYLPDLNLPVDFDDRRADGLVDV